MDRTVPWLIVFFAVPFVRSRLRLLAAFPLAEPGAGRGTKYVFCFLLRFGRRGIPGFSGAPVSVDFFPEFCYNGFTIFRKERISPGRETGDAPAEGVWEEKQWTNGNPQPGTGAQAEEKKFWAAPR